MEGDVPGGVQPVMTVVPQRCTGEAAEGTPQNVPGAAVSAGLQLSRRGLSTFCDEGNSVYSGHKIRLPRRSLVSAQLSTWKCTALSVPLC